VEVEVVQCTLLHRQTPAVPLSDVPSDLLEAFGLDRISVCGLCMRYALVMCLSV